ncbi:MAG: DUF6728 family protein [Bacteroidota bacterium]
MRTKNTLKDYFALGEVFGYFFRKPDPARATNFNLRMMHRSNRIAMVMGMAGIIYIIVKLIIRH